MFPKEEISVAVAKYTLKMMMVYMFLSYPITAKLYILSGLKFELLSDGITVEEDVGTVDLCITYRGDNVPPTIDAAFGEHTYGNL